LVFDDGEEGGITGADLRAALEASCLRGAFPPVDLRAVCYDTASVQSYLGGKDRNKGNKGSEEVYLGTSHLKSEKLMRKAKVC